MDEDKFNALAEEVQHRFGSPDEFSQAEGNHRMYMYVYPAFYDYRHKWLRQWIDESRTDKNSWDTLNLIAQEFLRRGGLLSPELAGWVAEVLAEIRPRPPKGKRETRRNERMLNAVIYLIDEHKLKPTRRPRERKMATQDPRRCHAEGGTASDVVGKAFGVGFSVVRGVWDAFQRSKKKK